jgi:hypothetical protein
MKNFLYLLPLLTLACAQTPKKEYHWVSLSEQGYVQNDVKVVKPTKDFQSDHGFDGLEIKKQKTTGPATVQKIVFVGDTGCRMKETNYGDRYQDCKNPVEWNYAAVMDKITAEKPDLVIHVGDYHYREQCSPGKPCRAMTDTIGYGWKTWESDFFAPSEKGFALAPWIFVRGNHEECVRAFEGYKLITEQKWDHACVDQEKTEYIRLGDLLIVQLDSSTISDDPAKTEQAPLWEKQFGEIAEHLKDTDAKQIWLVTHKPLAGLTTNRKGELVSLNVHLRNAFIKSGLNKKINLMIGGHIHNTQYLNIDDLPIQLVVGNSGTALDNIEAFQHPENILHHTIDGLKINEFKTDLKSPRSIGYTVLSKGADDKIWTVAFHDIDGVKTFAAPAQKAACAEKSAILKKRRGKKSAP